MPADFNQHLIIISLDALNAQDLEYLKELPNFKSFIEEGAYVKEVTSVYPTVTYTCHTSIITGTYPKKHGVFTNELIQPEQAANQEWFWYEKYIKVPTLFDYANKAKLITANVLWPVMAGAPIIYNCPEIWSVTGESYLSLYLKNASKRALPFIIKHKKESRGKQQPYLDNFVESVAIDMIIKKKPNLLCIHLIELDHERHVMGLHQQTINTVIKRLDERVGNIIKATKKAGIYDNTTFVLLGDHGCTDFSNVVYMNTMFAQEGFLTIDKNRQITSWSAYANSCGGSTHIYINKNCDKLLRQKITAYLDNLTVMPNTFIKKLYTKEEASEKYNLDGNFDFVIESKNGYVFRNSVTAEPIINRTEIKNCFVADHGQEPTHPDLKTLFFAKGSKIKRGAILDTACIVDEGPTFAKILGLEMENVDGRILTDILN